MSDDWLASLGASPGARARAALGAAGAVLDDANLDNRDELERFLATSRPPRPCASIAP